MSFLIKIDQEYKNNIMKKIVTLLILFIGFSAFAQVSQLKEFTYAVVTVKDGSFTKKKNVEVDLGDSPLQIKQGEEFSESLNKSKSHAAILNFMSSHKYVLVETKTVSASYNGSGGSYGVVFIMRKQKEQTFN